MKTRKFQVANIHDGLEQIRLEVGEDAVILDTRKLASGGVAKYEISVGVSETDSDASAELVAGMSRPTASVDRITGTHRALTATSSVERMLRQISHRIESIESEVRSLRRTQSKSDATKQAPLSPSMAGVAEELRNGLFKIIHSQSVDNFGATVSQIYGALKSCGISERHVEELIARAMSADNGWEEKPVLLEENVFREIHQRIKVHAPIWEDPRRYRDRIHVLVGPTGVGKTTSIAKIAAHLQYKAHERVGVICTDTFRVGGVYQLRAYAELLEIEFAVASNAEELVEARNQLADCDVILIDTVGHNPWDVSEKKGLTAREIRDVLAENGPKFHVCLSAVTDPAALAGIIETYLCLDPTSMIFTKCDEARGLGSLYSAILDAQLPVSHICHGQRVPDTIIGPSAEQVTRWIIEGHHSLLHSGKEGAVRGAADSSKKAHSA